MEENCILYSLPSIERQIGRAIRGVSRMEEADRIKREILREYDRDPTGWHVFAARDSRGYFDTVVVHGREVWLIKEHAVNPFESVGFGIRSLADDLRLEAPPYTFGFRPVDRESMEQVLRRASEGQSLLDTLRTILERSPQPLREIRTPLALGGPVLVGRESRLDIFPQQRELDRRLRSELDRLLMKRYPHLFTMYR
jgi:hypothetical protein